MQAFKYTSCRLADNPHSQMIRLTQHIRICSRFNVLANAMLNFEMKYS